MKIIFSFLFYFLFYLAIIAQSITFEKHFGKGIGYSVVQTTEDDFIIAGRDANSISSDLTNSKLRVLKVDKHGEKVWEKNYDALGLNSPFITTTSDGNFVVIAIKKTGEVVNLFLIKINSNGDTLWTRLFASVKNEFCSFVVETKDNGFIISGYASASSSLSSPDICEVLIKTDSIGNVIWKKNYYLPFTSYTTRLPVVEFYDGYALLANSKLLKVSRLGDSLWTSILSSISYSMIKTSDEGILLPGNNYVTKIDSAGNNVWVKPLSGRAYFINQTNDSCFILVGREWLKKINQQGDTLWSKTISGGFPSFIGQTRDNGFIIAGENGNIKLIKTDANGNYSSLILWKPQPGEYLTIGSEYNFEWESKNVFRVKCEISTDNGFHWLTIAEQISETNKFKWTVLNLPSSNCKLKIIDTDKNYNYDISDSTFTIGYNPNYDFVAVNQIKMWIGNNGDGSHDPITDGQGFYWPGGKDATIGASFEDGLLWGGKIDGKIYVNGNTHRQGLKPGKILPDGNAGSAEGIWKIKKDWQLLPGGPEKDRYEYNYQNWPGDLGAPFIDEDEDGKFTKGIDQPGFLGDEVLWFVANDLDTATSIRTYGSNPIGLEVQVSTFGYDRQDDLADVVFKKYKLINRSGKEIKDMYLSYWADPDLGDASDDYIGCDSTLNLGFCYNGKNDDYMYGSPPPAIGYLLLQGPILLSEISDSARFDDRWKHGYKNLGMTMFTPIIKNWMPGTTDPSVGIYEGTLQMYNNMRCLTTFAGNPLTDPNTGLSTKYGLSGDPIAGSGWYEGKGWPGGPLPYDRRLMVDSGPSKMASEDTQEVVYAIIMARGTDNINSVAELKRKAKVVQEFYDSHIPTDVKKEKILPAKFELYQNYPNPFNPSTTISFVIPNSSFVILKIFDVLGEEVATLINEELKAGIHHYTLSTINYKLSSGVYLIQLKSGEKSLTQKMLMLK
ncbi:MAG: T9SS type A sorting domain-containing protein [Ignavibacteriales bacterium]|nr:T9SS type A sorting domain-containing protein [Ignavibacteriales bacterium]